MSQAIHLMPGAVEGALNELRRILGPERVVTQRSELEFHSQDVYRIGKLPAALIRPASTEQLALALRAIASSGLPIVPRGGGMSYTDGYLPTLDNSIMVDVQAMNRVVAIDAEDGYVTVDCGATWKELFDALAPHGVRTPYFGPLSGLRSTIGGALSQGSMFLGSGRYGAAAESVIGLDIVLVDGTVLHLGAHANRNGEPFYRQIGPDTLGMFLSDCGALGIKTAVALRLMKRNSHVMGLSFGFKDFSSLASGMEAAAKLGLNLTNFGLDPALQQGQLGKADVATAMQSALAVWKTSRGPLDGLVQLTKMAFAGRGFLKGAVFSGHWIVDGVDDASCRAAVAKLRAALQPHGAEVPATVPTVANAMPFMPLYNVRSPRGERWVPIHGILPFSRVEAFRAEISRYYEAHEADMKRLRIRYGAMFMTVATNAFLYEPVFYWEDGYNIAQERLLPAGYQETLPKFADNPEGRALVDKMKHGIADIFQRHGAIHLQIGKFYPYMRGRDPQTAELIRSVKQLIDPQRRLNPGALGL